MQAASASSRPRFRTDLVAEPIDEDGQRFIDVIDPDTGNAFRFYEIEYSIACAMDGERDVGGLASWAREELGITPSPDELTQVISTLGDLGYLEGAAAYAPMFGEDLVQKGVVVPPQASVSRAPEIELGVGGWTAPAAPAFESRRGGGDDVELGRAGGKPMDRGAALESMDVGLGAAGFIPHGPGEEAKTLEFEQPTPPPMEPGQPILPALRPSTKPSSEVAYEDGPTNLPQPHTGDFDDDEVSVDLSEHLAIRPDDVKEAVRASQVMKAVDVPPELLAQLDDREAGIASAAAAARAGAAEAAKQAAHAQAPMRSTPVMMPAQPDPGIAMARPPVELPREPVAVGKSKPTKQQLADAARQADAAKQPVAVQPVAVQPAGGTSPVLLILLVLVVLAAGGFLVWKYVINANNAKTTDSTSQKGTDEVGTGAASGTAGSAAVGSAGSAAVGSAGSAVGSAGSAVGSAGSAGPVGTVPAAPSGTLHGGGAAVVVEVKAPQAGVVAVAATPGAPIAAGDTVARLLASPRTEQKLAEIDYDLTKRYPADVKRNTDLAAAARAAHNEALAKQYDAKVAEREKRIDERTKERAKYADELTKLELKSSGAGTVKKAVARGAQVAANQVVVTIEQSGGGLTADLNVPGATYAVGDTVKVASKKAPDQQVECKVAAVAGAKVTVACPADSGWADGTEIVLVVAK